MRPAPDDFIVSRRVAVIGAGWSGLACALEVVRHGHAVTLLDASAQPGGRARAVRLPLGDGEFMLDNGQHLLIGAYRDTLRLMRDVGVDVGAALLRLPFELRYPDGFSLRAWRLPAPLHLAAALLAARGLDWASRRHAFLWVQRWRRCGWRLADDAPASTLFADAPAALRRRLWRPLCLAALNVEPEQASAQVLLNVLRAIDAAPITTVYLRYPAGTRLDRPALALLDDAAAGRYGQWVFDRGQLDAANDGVMSVVISAAAVTLQLEVAQIAAAVAGQLSRELALPAPLASTVITEKRATIVPSPGLQRPAARLPVPGLYLAGDAAASAYPSTLEGSVRAGLAAAQTVIEDEHAGR